MHSAVLPPFLRLYRVSGPGQLCALCRGRRDTRQGRQERNGERFVVWRRGSLPVWRFAFRRTKMRRTIIPPHSRHYQRPAMPPSPLPTGGPEASDGRSNGIDSWQGRCRTFGWRLGIPLLVSYRSEGRSNTLPMWYEDVPISDIEPTPSLVKKRTS